MKVHESKIPVIYELIQPKMAEIKARYPECMNIEGFEPALSSDVAEVIAWYINETYFS